MNSMNFKAGTVLAVCIFAAGCTPYQVVDNSAECPAPGTEVAFNKVMAPGFAEDFVGCEISTVVEFVGMGAGPYIVAVSTEGKTVFRVLPPGERGPSNPFTGESMANIAVLPKTESDILFKLKPGDKIVLVGGTYVRGASSLGKFVSKSEGYSESYFIATSVKNIVKK